MLKPFRGPATSLFSRHFRFPGRRRRAGGEGFEVVLDLSRLLSRSYIVTPSGVDRVEMAYARELLDRMPDRLAFGAVHPAGGYYGRLAPDAVRQFLSSTLARWENRVDEALPAVRRAAMLHLLALRPRPVPPRERTRVYLQASPHHLEDARMVETILAVEDARFAALVHDVIPIQHPEYARPDGADEHRRRLATLDRFADGIIGNSQATLDQVQRYLGERRTPRITGVAHLGFLEEASWGEGAAVLPGLDRPYFVCVATIEPRKNHLLLLNLWRRLVEERGAAAPQLVLIGRRGWENENVVDMLERCEALKGVVFEESEAPDRLLRGLLRGARALLLPSFAEGFGMPVVEALASGVPVICSDIPALREAGDDVPDYLDPLDGLGWMRAIVGYTAADSPERAAQVRRMAGWRPTTWRTHIDQVMDVVERVAA